MKVISWFSGGITSTVATMMAIDKYGVDNVEIVFFETGSHHKDNDRFFKECEEKLFNKKITIRRNKKYKDLHDVLIKGKFLNSAKGARCTKVLKKDVRIMIEKITDYDAQVFGFEFESNEVNRAIRFKEQYPDAKPIFPLINSRLTKLDCVDKITKMGIELPMMYRLGYTNNNCIGCVKGGMGYWNKIRVDFPDVFKKMSEIEREIGATCLRDGKKRLFLDELDKKRGRKEKPIVAECGVICATEFNHIESPDLKRIMNGEKDI